MKYWNINKIVLLKTLLEVLITIWIEIILYNYVNLILQDRQGKYLENQGVERCRRKGQKAFDNYSNNKLYNNIQIVILRESLLLTFHYGMC